MGLDFTTETHDAGLHLPLRPKNISIFESTKGYFNLIDKRNDPELKALGMINSYYYNMEQEQYQELEEYGYLLKFNLKRTEEK